MSKQVHRIGDPDTAGAAVIASLQSTVFVNGILASVNGSPVVSHPVFHTGVTTANGSSNVFINNIPVNRTGDPDTCGHTRAAGSPNVFVN